MVLALFLACSKSSPSSFARTIDRDLGNIAILQDDGHLLDARNPAVPGLSNNGLPVARRFYQTHTDGYDFLVIFTDRFQDAAWYHPVRNTVRGIGYEIFDETAKTGSSGRLQGIVYMGGVGNRISAGVADVPNRTLDVLAEEIGHRWMAGVHFIDAKGETSDLLLGRDLKHWSPLLDSDGSAMEGFDWRDNGDGTFTATAYKRGIYSPLDLYLMGLYAATDVPPLLLIHSPDVSRESVITGSSSIRTGSTISGTARQVTIADIIAAEGPRNPDFRTAQKQFRAAFILVVEDQLSVTDLIGIEQIRQSWEKRFPSITAGRGTFDTRLVVPASGSGE